jgi:two-component system, NarL family, nitrate/nitrite response regulator NarL
MDKPIRVVIADDHAILRDGLRKLLEAEQGFEVVGEAWNGDEAVDVTRRVEPDILLLDLAMPGRPGLEVLRELNDKSLPTRTIVLTASIERDEVIKALQLGARGLVMKESASELLINAIRTVMAGQYWVGRESVSELMDALRSGTATSDDPKSGLTARELEIVSAVTAGLTNREIAKKLGLSVKTVKHHLTRVHAKLGVGDRPEPQKLLNYLADLVDIVPAAIAGVVRRAQKLMDYLADLLERFRRRRR